MKSLELTVSAEQVSSFIKDGFDDFIDDSLIEGPTNGLMNYFRHAGSLSYRVKSYRILPLPDEVRGYFTEVQTTTSLFELYFQSITSHMGIIGEEEDLQEHYNYLIKIAELYCKGMELEKQFKTVPELKIINSGLRRQVQVANILFDKDKRERHFQHLMWGSELEFDHYLDSLPLGN